MSGGPLQEGKDDLRSMGRRLAAALTALLLACFSAAAGEEFIPPSPEPAAPARDDRPTPGPTEVPDTTLVDHINFPREYRNFSFQRGKKLLEIWFPNIKDADEAVLTYDGQVYMIDCGDERAAARGAVLLTQLGITKIDLLFNTHLHHDHINGLAITDDTAKVAALKICFPPESTESGLRMLETARERNIPITEYKNGDVFKMGDGAVTLTFLMNSDPELDMNSRSAVTLVKYGERTILFTADMEKPGQEALLKQIDPSILKCDILKYPHHAKNALTEEFFYALDMKLAVVTSVHGRDDYGQTYLVAKHMPAAYTSVKGKFIHLATDGAFWLCEYVDVVEPE